MAIALWIGAIADETNGESVAAPSRELLNALTGDEIAQRINQRDEGGRVFRKMTIELISKSGAKRVQQTRIYRKNHEDAKRTVIFYEEPGNVRGTAFLNVDYWIPGKEDVRWLYLPVTRRPRRIATSDRGDYFLGTDLTYEDINNETKVNMADYTRKNLGVETLNGKTTVKMEARPVNEESAKELQYSRIVSYVDPGNWMLVRADYWDLDGERLKTIAFEGVRKVQDIWTAGELSVVNHQSGHRTRLLFEDIDYQAAIDDDLFTVRALSRGP